MIEVNFFLDSLWKNIVLLCVMLVFFFDWDWEILWKLYDIMMVSIIGKVFSVFRMGLFNGKVVIVIGGGIGIGCVII